MAQSNNDAADAADDDVVVVDQFCVGGPHGLGD
jgi:hypothetical protein